jgi:hypothetical protein
MVTLVARQTDYIYTVSSTRLTGLQQDETELWRARKVRLGPKSFRFWLDSPSIPVFYGP